MSTIPHLSPQQATILELLCRKGQSDAELGAALGIAPQTVANQFMHVRAQLHLREGSHGRAYLPIAYSLGYGRGVAARKQESQHA